MREYQITIKAEKGEEKIEFSFKGLMPHNLTLVFYSYFKKIIEGLGFTFISCTIEETNFFQKFKENVNK